MPRSGAATRIRGDAEIAGRYRELFALARPDFEEELSRFDRRCAGAAIVAVREGGLLVGCATAGAPPGKTSPNICRKRAATWSIRAELEEFLLGVDQSRETADRIEIRLARLERRLKGTRVMRLRVAARLLQIQRALVRHGLDDFVRATHLYRPFRFLFYLSPWTWFQRSDGATRGERLRLALEELGPIFVKFGQALSTRRDLLPVDIADELAKLQDRVPPFDGAVAVATIERTFGRALADTIHRLRPDPSRRRLDRAGACGKAARAARKSW